MLYFLVEFKPTVTSTPRKKEEGAKFEYKKPQDA